MVCGCSEERKLIALFTHLVQEGIYESLFQGDGLSTWGLTEVQFRALQYIYLHPGCTLCEMADGLLISNAAATKLVQRLEGKGLLWRREAPQDRRRMELYPTEKGERLWTFLQEAFQQRLEEVLRRMDPIQQKHLLEGVEAFLYAALNTPEMVERACLRCGTAHRPDCWINLCCLELTGKEIAPV